MPSFRDQAHAEAHYGQKIESATELHQLQRLEKRYGARLHGWLAEGMPKAAMGHPKEMADFRIQRALEGTGTSQEDVPGVVLDALGSQGQSLDGTIQRTLERRMDADFSNVRIHTGAKAADAADAIDAKAFTCGSDIVFNSGAYDLESPEGQHLLAHELAHVKQQTGAAISMMPQEGAQLEIDPDPQLEREAEEEAARVMSGGELGIQRFPDTEFHIQRMANWGEHPLAEGDDRSTLRKVLDKIDPRSALREGGEDVVTNTAESNSAVRVAAHLLALVGVSGPVFGATGSKEAAGGSHLMAATVIKHVGAEPIRAMNGAMASQLYNALVEVGYERLASAWAQAVQYVHGEAGDTSETRFDTGGDN